MKKTVLSLAAGLCMLAAWTGVARAQSASDLQLRDRIVDRLSADPRTANAYYQVDTWNGLVVLHGWAVNERTRAVLDRKVREMADVGQVYNYTVTDQSPAREIEREIYRSQSIDLAIAHGYDQVYDLGVVTGLNKTLREAPQGIYLNLPRVTPYDDRLALDVKYSINGTLPFVGVYKIRVDDYNGLIILHGVAPTTDAARLAESIAANVPGVKQVYSYIQTEEEIAPPDLTWPVVVDLTHEPLPVGQPRVEGPVYVQYDQSAPCPSR